MNVQVSGDVVGDEMRGRRHISLLCAGGQLERR
jgi:hypothetical protein